MSRTRSLRLPKLHGWYYPRHSPHPDSGETNRKNVEADLTAMFRVLLRATCAVAKGLGISALVITYYMLRKHKAAECGAIPNLRVKTPLAFTRNW